MSSVVTHCHLLYPFITRYHSVSPVIARCHALLPFLTRRHPFSPGVTRSHPSSPVTTRRHPSLLVVTRHYSLSPVITRRNPFRIENFSLIPNTTYFTSILRKVDLRALRWDSAGGNILHWFVDDVELLSQDALRAYFRTICQPGSMA